MSEDQNPQNSSTPKWLECRVREGHRYENGRCVWCDAELQPLSPQTAVPIDLSDSVVRKVLWAAMCAMVSDIHAPQDNLSESEWLMAGRVFAVLNALTDGEPA